MGDKSPAFQFYPKDYLTDPKVVMMSPDQRGGYMHLLAYMWLEPECKLPDDDDVLINLSGLLKGGLSVVKQCFKKDGNFLFSKRLSKEKEKQKEWKEKSSRGGKMSAKVRWGNELQNVRVVKKSLPPNCNTSSSSSSSSSNIKIYKKYFESFWKKYPKKDGKKMAEKHFLSSVKNEEDFKNINKALNNYLYHIKSNKLSPQFIKNGSTWFFNWEDWINYERFNSTPSSTPTKKVKPEVKYEDLSPKEREKYYSPEEQVSFAKSLGVIFKKNKKGKK